MDKITRNNYEEFFIDYFDGNLNNHEVAELMLFLAQNTDLDNEFNEFKYIELGKEPVKFEFKELLKKQDTTITGSVFTDKCIDKIENNLSEKQAIDFNNEIKINAKKRNEYELFKKTIIKPNLNVIFKEKELLKKQETSRKYYLKFKRVYQYAAILIAIVISYTLINNNSKFEKISNKTNKKQIVSSVVKYGNLSSFDKYDNQQSFTVIKRETPKIVSKSNSNIETKKPIVTPIHIDKINAELIVVDNKLAVNNIPEYRNNVPTLFIPKINTNSGENSELLITNNSTEIDKKCNPTAIKSLTNEIKSDIYISEMMNRYKNDNNSISNNNNTKTVWELLGKKFSEITGTNIEKIYDEEGKVAKLAINTNRFRVSKKIRK